MTELDRSRPFDRVWGIVGEGEPYFFQDGKSFDSDGAEIVSEVAEVADQEPVAEEPKKKARKKATNDVVELTDENHDLL